VLEASAAARCSPLYQALLEDEVAARTERLAEIVPAPAESFAADREHLSTAVARTGASAPCNTSG